MPLSDWNVSNVSNFGNMLDNTAISAPNYDNLLISWDGNLDLINDKTLGAVGLHYCKAETQRQSIIDTDNWTINDAGKDCSDYLPKAEYHFDACMYNGTEDEVIDNSTNNYNGTAHTATTTAGLLNNSVDLSADTVEDYISLDNSALDGLNDFTISVWIKTAKTGSQAVLSGANSSSYNEVLMWLNNGSFNPHIKGQKKSIPVTVADDTWHMLTWTRQSDKNCIYVDGNASGCVTGLPTGAVSIDVGGLILGQEQDSVGGGFDAAQNFVGLQDELKLFGVPLGASQITELYNNENSHKNYDGSHRMAVDCTPIEFLAEYRFDECEYIGASGEVLDSQGGNNSGTIINDATIDKNTKKIGNALSLSSGAVDIDNLAVSTDTYKKNTVMFWMYWDGTNSVMPFGWDRYDLWLYDGNFGFNDSHSLMYGTSSSNLDDGWHHIAAVFTNGDIESNRLYIDGSLQTISIMNSTIHNANALAQAHAHISGWLASEDYRFSGYLDEFKIFKGELDGDNITAYFNNESSATRDIICSKALFNAVNSAGGCFNWDNNITTKIAGENITLTILSADENDNNNSLTDTNITKLELLSFTDASCSTLYDTSEIWSGNEAVDSDACWNPSAFHHDKSIKCAKIKITGLYEGSSVESNSTDTFSIRPDKFVLTNIPTGKLTAEHNYTIQAKAVNSNGTTNSADYNQTLTPQSHKYFRDDTNGSAMAGDFLPTNDFNFTDGTTQDTTLSFSDVGKVGLELNDTTWAEVDADDTPLVDRTIYLEQNLTFIPDRFEITFDATPTIDNHGRDFTYYANDLANMSADLKNLSFKVRALGKSGSIMTNYQNPQATYFANNSQFALGLGVRPVAQLAQNINESSTKDLGFNAGVATLTYSDIAFNFGRERNVTKNPLFLDGTNSDINISVIDDVDHEVNGTTNQHFDGNATFYYGRIKTHDIKTAESPTTEKLDIDVYWDGTGTRILPLAFKQQTASWYTNTDDDSITSLNNADFKPMAKRKLATTQSGTILSVVTPNAQDGQVGFSITKSVTSTSQNLFYHVDIPAWLWYSRYEDYSFAPNSTCAEHPCFEYIFKAVNNTIGIKSGSKTGSSFNNDFGASTKRKAIKILR